MRESRIILQAISIWKFFHSPAFSLYAEFREIWSVASSTFSICAAKQADDMRTLREWSDDCRAEIFYTARKIQRSDSLSTAVASRRSEKIHAAYKAFPLYPSGTRETSRYRAIPSSATVILLLRSSSRRARAFLRAELVKSSRRGRGFAARTGNLFEPRARARIYAGMRDGMEREREGKREAERGAVCAGEL